MPVTETTSKKTTYFDPVLVVEETSGMVSVGLKRNYLIETVTSGSPIDRETGDQWLVYESKKFVWKDEDTSSTSKQWIMTVPSDIWKALQTFLLSFKGV